MPRHYIFEFMVEENKMTKASNVGDQLQPIMFILQK